MSTSISSKPTATSGYAISRAEPKCLQCDRNFEPADKMMAALRDTPTALERIDLCLDCWKDFDRAGLLGFWQTHPQPVTAKKKVFVDDDVLCDLLERLAEVTEPAKVNFRFVLGLILMRKRRIVYESTRVEDEKEIWSIRFRGREDLLDLVNPKLNEEQVAEVSTQLGEILNGDL